MNERLSAMVDAALRSISQGGEPSMEEIATNWLALAELMKDIGIFARDMERTEALHAAEPARQVLERAGAAERLYGRLLDPPRCDNVARLPIKGIGRALVIVGRP